MIHELKILPEYFNDVISGNKTFEIRRNDRNFLVGDYIALNEFVKKSGYTGRSALYRITYVAGKGHPPVALPDGYVILGIHPCNLYDVNESFGETLKPTVTESFEERGQIKF